MNRENYLKRDDYPETMTMRQLYEVVCVMADKPNEVSLGLAARVIAQSLKHLLGQADWA